MNFLARVLLVLSFTIALGVLGGIERPHYDLRALLWWGAASISLAAGALVLACLSVPAHTPTGDEPL